jgi:acetate kinase
MNSDKSCILTINSGSSTIKFALYRIDTYLKCILHGKVDKTGYANSKISFSIIKENLEETIIKDVSCENSMADFLIDWLEKQNTISSIKAVGHRVVHGMNHFKPELITNELLDELHRIIPYDPDHMPNEIELIEVFRNRYPKLLQFACFDTAFHCTMPRVAKLLPIPRHFDAMGIRRYGFHGLSYAYLMEKLNNVEDPKTAHGRVILAHLGNGASMAAVKDGKSIDTSMGFTPAAGLMMGTRPGDLDPGVAWYLMQSEHMTPEQFNNLINKDSGLLGVSEISSDMRDLLRQEKNDVRAAEAIALFCYQVKKWIGAFTAVLGGLDILVFSGGIGESAPVIRSRICEGLGFLGINLEENRNVANKSIISKDATPVTVRVIHTDEEWIIAKTVNEKINNQI